MGDFHSDEGATIHGSKAEPVTAPMRTDYIQWEYKEIETALGEKGKRLHQSLQQGKGRLIDRILIEGPEQKRHVFYFDVTQIVLALGNAIKKNDAAAKAAPTPGRNEPCPCGSQKKYKKCCGK